MFYKDIFTSGEQLGQAGDILNIEAHTVALLVNGDRGFIKQAEANDLVSVLVHKLWNIGVISSESKVFAESYLRANLNSIHRFIKKIDENKGSIGKQDFLVPDMKKIKDLLGHAEADKWAKIISVE